MDGYEQARWSRFCGGLLSYIEHYYCSFITTDYEINLDMPFGEIIKELQNSQSFSELSPQLQKVAKQYKESIENEALD